MTHGVTHGVTHGMTHTKMLDNNTLNKLRNDKMLRNRKTSF